MPDTLNITVCFSPEPRTVHEMALQLQNGSTISEAVTLASLHKSWPSNWLKAQCQSLSVGIWGRKSDWNTPLRDGDRVELCRDLLVDPKTARRERFSKQGARRAGLFAKKRPGAAAGY